MASVKAKFRPSTTEGQPGVIYFQIIQNRVARTLTTSYKVYADEWDSHEKRIVPSYARPERISLLQHYQECIRLDLFHFKECVIYISRKKETYTADEVIETFRKQFVGNSLKSFMASLIHHLNEQSRIRTAETYRGALDSFMLFRNGNDIPLSDIDQELIESYEVYLKRRGLTLNSISFYMRILRAAYNKAVAKELTPQKRPFIHVYTGIEKTVKRAVNIHIIRHIKEKAFPPHDIIGYARDMFMFSFYTRGMSFVDMAYLKKTDLHNGILTYRRKKTGQQLSIKWEKCMQDIIDKYPANPTEHLLPIILSPTKDKRVQYKNSQALINRKLKILSIMIHSPHPLSMYVARHSWASIAKSKHIPLSIISESMGHNSESTTQIYLASLDTSVIDQANYMILNELL